MGGSRNFQKGGGHYFTISAVPVVLRILHLKKYEKLAKNRGRPPLNRYVRIPIEGTPNTNQRSQPCFTPPVVHG